MRCNGWTGVKTLPRTDRSAVGMAKALAREGHQVTEWALSQASPTDHLTGLSGEAGKRGDQRRWKHGAANTRHPARRVVLRILTDRGGHHQSGRHHIHHIPQTPPFSAALGAPRACPNDSESAAH